jgi:chromosome segregation ATPase
MPSSSQSKKRSRPTEEEEGYEPVDNEEEDDDIVEEDGVEEDDGGEYSRENDEEEEERPKKKRKAPSKKAGRFEVEVEGGEADDESNIDPTKEQAGTISRILVENFMCHDKLEMHFNRRITIINGPNGSGKSAVLTGLQTCLGAKTSETHRGSTIKDLIKTGKDWAQITIEIRNIGDDSFKHDQYGDVITVVRRIDRHASSSYKIKSTSGKVVATTFKELKLMMDQFNIQIDNPTAVMTQDVSREFLATASNAKKFVFFERATQLEKMTDEYDKTNKFKWKLDSALKGKKEKLIETEKELKEYKREYEESRALEKMETEISALQTKVLCAIVKEKRNEYRRFDEKVRQEEPKVRKLEERQNSEQGGQDELKRQIDEQLKEIEAIKVEVEKLKDEVGGIDKQIIEIGRRRTPFVAEEQEYKQRIERAKGQIKKTEKEIGELREKSKIDRSAERQKIESKLESLREEAAKFKQRKEDLDKDIDLHEQQVRKSTATLKDMRETKDGYENQMKRFQDSAANLERQKKDKMEFFSRIPLKAILHEIQQQRSKFHKVPIGPIGLLITVKDLKWAPAIEWALKNDIQNFICHDTHDQKLLANIVKYVNSKGSNHQGHTPTIFVQNFSDTVYDVSRARPSKDFTTIMDMVDLDEHSITSQPVRYGDMESLRATVFNVLINQSRIESTVLIESMEEARKTMFPRPPPGADNCFTIDGSRLFMRGGAENYLGAKQTFSKLWSANKDEQIRQLKAQADEVKQKLESVKEEGRQLTTDHRELQNKLINMTKGQSKLKTEINGVERKIRDVESELRAEDQSESAINIESAIDELKRSIEEKTEQIKEFEGIIENAQMAMEKLTVEENTRKDERQKKINEQKKQTESMKQKGKDYEKTMKELAQMKLRDQEGTKMLAQAKNTLALLREKLEECRHAKEEAESSIEGTEYVEVGDQSSEALAREQERIKKKLKEERKKFNDRSVSEIKDAYLRRQKVYDDTKNRIELSESNYKEISNALISRFNKWLKIREGFQYQTSIWFNAYLSQKGHSGSINFDNEKKELNMEIFLDSGANPHKKGAKGVEDAKSLSGGERSFSTVAFLLALWHVVESPFRALDEFDIFMDANYRMISLTTIIKEAEKRGNMQLILLTPHSVTGIQASENLKIVKLRPPERHENQRTMEEFMRAHQV